MRGNTMKEKRPVQKESDLLKLARPAQRALAGAGIQRLEQLTKLSEDEVKQLHGIGPNALVGLRRALTDMGFSFAGEKKRISTKKRTSPVNNTKKVDEFMDKLNHPFKAEVQAIREIIKNVNKDITEEIKWKAPSFSYKGEYLVTFNLWAKEHIHLVFHNPMISKVKSKLFEGNYEHRRMAYFSDMKNIKAKRAALEKALKDLIKLQKNKENL
jgi:uncharacterized protein YdhG (YjbR/CyaY superfamily)